MPLAEELRAAHAALFEAMLEHRFVREMTEDRIAPEVFRRYLVQEGAFVRTAMRVFALALAKAPEDADLDRLARIVHALATTQSDYFIEAAGGAPTGMAMPPEAAELGEVALGIAAAGSFAEILSAMLAAEWMYLDWCTAAAARGRATGWRKAWIDLHLAPDFEDQVAWLRQRVDSLGAGLDAVTRQRCHTAFGRMLRHEIAFHDAPYGPGWGEGG